MRKYAKCSATARIRSVLEQLGDYPAAAVKLGLKSEACIRQWAYLGVPEKHWTLIIKYSDTDATELHKLNDAVRKENGMSMAV